MNEERKMILQMIADGKITPDEAELLLQAIDDGERAARSAAAEGVRTGHAGSGSAGLGETIERAVRDTIQGLDGTLRRLETDLDARLNGHRLRHRIEERLRREAERAVERAQHAERRAARIAQRAAERAAEHAQRTARKGYEKAYRVVAGISFDKESVQQSESQRIAAQPGDRLVLENRIGDLAVEFYEGDQIMVDARKTVWGTDRADAETRSAATRIELVRRGSLVEVCVVRPLTVGVGIIVTKDTRIDYVVQVPYGTDLDLRNKVGDLQVTAGPTVGNWQLHTRVGDVQVTVPPEAGFRYDLRATLGDVSVNLPGLVNNGAHLIGSVGDASGSVEASAKTGNVKIRS